MVRVIDRTLESPEGNLSFDDSLLDDGRETLRFWESPEHFVVLGRSGRIEREVDAGACRRMGIPVLRRSSGGGAVLQGPGCLNYTLILSLERRVALLNVAASYEFVLGRVVQGLGVDGLEVRDGDILLQGRKISGNAQRRTKGWLLHHGTVLHGLDVRLVEQLLPEPRRRPAHRGERSHREFLTALDLEPRELKRRIADVWTQA